jgi:hypothetical protein
VVRLGGHASTFKLHELAVKLRNSTLLHDLWDLEINLSLGIDNDTRWSSWYHVLDRAMRKKEQIIKFIHKHADALKDPERDNLLSHSDWEIIDRTHAFLQVFASGTLWVEGDQASLSQSLEMMDAILALFEEQKV